MTKVELWSRDCPPLKQYLTSETYTHASSDVQNEIIEIINKRIQKDIVDSANKSEAFSLMLDGIQDVCVHE